MERLYTTSWQRIKYWITFNNTWPPYKNKMKEFNFRSLRVSLRRSVRIYNKKAYPCVDLVNIEVNDGLEGQGNYKLFEKTLLKIIKEAELNYYAECILNPKFENHFQANPAFIQTNGQPTPCFLMILSTNTLDINSRSEQQIQ